MIDFGIDWCSEAKLPHAYSKIKSIKEHTSLVKKELFYCMCTLQLFMNILHIGTPLNVIKMILKPFYKDDLFIKYVLEDQLHNQLRFENTKEDVSRPKRMYRRSRKVANGKINFKQILKDMLDYKHDQAILLSYYIRKDKTQTNSEIVDYVFNTIKEIAILIFKK
jgi:hypothetical protein